MQLETVLNYTAQFRSTQSKLFITEIRVVTPHIVQIVGVGTPAIQ